MTRLAGPLSRICADGANDASTKRNAAAVRAARAAGDLMRGSSIVLLRRGPGDRLVAPAAAAALRDERILEILHVEAHVGEEALRVLEARRDLRGRRLDAL